MKFGRPNTTAIKCSAGQSEIGRAHVELQSPDHLVCRLLLEKKKFLPPKCMCQAGSLIRNCTDICPGFMKCSILCLDKKQRAARRGCEKLAEWSEDRTYCAD